MATDSETAFLEKAIQFQAIRPQFRGKHGAFEMYSQNHLKQEQAAYSIGKESGFRSENVIVKLMLQSGKNMEAAGLQVMLKIMTRTMQDCITEDVHGIIRRFSILQATLSHL